MDVVALASRIPNMIFGSKSDDDFSDRLNYRYTVALLILFSIIITTRQFGSETIKCWVPAHFTSNYEQYASQICWISNTYYNEPNENIPKEEAERRKNEIKYYQWVSFVLLFQAFLFYAPRILWRTASTRSGLDMCDLIEAANNYKSADKFDGREKFMNYLVVNINQYVDDQRRYDENRPNFFTRLLLAFNPCAGRFLGNYIVILYFLVKFIYIVNTFIQVWILSGILGRNFLQFGIDFIDKLSRGQGWVIESKYFPKVTLCDFYIREIGHPNKSHRYTVQCVLPINLFNQQIFIIIWFWYILVLGWNIFEAVKWVSRCFPSRSSRWVTQRIILFNQCMKDPKIQRNSKKLQHFLDIYLEADGIFMVRMIANNASDFVATDLIKELWKKHYENYKIKFKNEPQDDEGCEISDVYFGGGGGAASSSAFPLPPGAGSGTSMSMQKGGLGGYSQQHMVQQQQPLSANIHLDDTIENRNSRLAYLNNRNLVSSSGEYFGVDANMQLQQHGQDAVQLQQRLQQPPSRIINVDQDEQTPFIVSQQLVNENNNMRRRDNATVAQQQPTQNTNSIITSTSRI